eukprot:TRINITY_DN14478_c0_g1_i3.p1 TRINITY_DN14478_c0_g1~~TRINITY_DN14478_c0_g1_i3.p1  ORF type:complete len:402 (-),score=83.32 TRINITY_DN14478_c0_g1_i3:732-1937(-)
MLPAQWCLLWLLGLLRCSLQVMAQNMTVCLPPKVQMEWESDLRAKLMDDYRPGAMPRVDNKAVKVDIGLKVVALSQMSQIDATFKMNVWLRMRWKDPRLIWNVRYANDGLCVSDSAGDLPCSMTFSTKREFPDAIWTPDILLYNSAEHPFQDLQMSQAIVMHDGTVTWARPGLLLATCKFDLVDFPNDVQNCRLQFGSWAYDAGTMELIVGEAFDPPVELDQGMFIENEEWDLAYDKYMLLNNMYSCCIYPYQVFEVYFKAIRRSHYYDVVFINPAYVLTASLVLSFAIPFNSGERISYVAAMILTLVLFLTTVAEQLPKTDQKVGLNQTFNALLYTSVSFLLVTVVWVKYQDHKHQAELRHHREKQNKLLKGASQRGDTTMGDDDMMEESTDLMQERRYG